MKRIILKIIPILSLIVVIIIIVYFKYTTSPLVIKIFGTSLLIVDSGSMQPEIQVGEAIIIQERQEYNKGDVITYNVENNYLITHRIVEKLQEGYITKGDSNNVNDSRVVKKEQIEGKVIFHSEVLGFICKYNIAIIIILLVIIILII